MRRSRTNCTRLIAAAAGLLVIVGCSSLKITLTIDPEFPEFHLSGSESDDDADVLDEGREG